MEELAESTLVVALSFLNGFWFVELVALGLADLVRERDCEEGLEVHEAEIKLTEILFSLFLPRNLAFLFMMVMLKRMT